jgi:sorting nexin-8
VAADHARIALSLTSLTETNADTYATDTNDVPLLNDGMQAMSKHLRTAQSLLEDEARAWDEGVLEDLKRQRDALVSLRDLFDRRERMDRDNIPYLERRIQANETKLAALRAKPDGMVKPGEIEKVVENIIKVGCQCSIPPATHPHAALALLTSPICSRTKKPSSTSTTAPSS